MYRQPEPSPIEELFWATAKDAIPELEREVWIGRYRVDFLVRHKRVIIELYGYQWHSTKEKLTQDAERERVLQQQGYHVVRFTGSEVHKNAQKCVRDVLAIIQTLPDTAATGEAQATPSQLNVTIRKSYFKSKSLFGLKKWQLGVLGGLFVLEMILLIGAAVVLLQLAR
jgi:very-short-patch-repair endonuclease